MSNKPFSNKPFNNKPLRQKKSVQYLWPYSISALSLSALNRRALDLVGQGGALGIAMVFWGWILAVYQMPKLGWIGTILCVLHLGWVGKSAIAPSSAWLLLIFWIAAQSYAEPRFLMWSKGEIWALSLLILWLMAMITLVAIAQTQTHFRWIKRPRRFFLVSTINLVGLWGGTQLIQFNLLEWLTRIAGS